MISTLSVSTKVYLVIISVFLRAVKNVSSEGVPENSTEIPTLTKDIEQIPQYHFRYYVQNADSGDYKTQEETRDGETVKGSYSVAEANGDLRVVSYTADIKGFKADVKIHPGASPMPSVRQTENKTLNNVLHIKNQSTPRTVESRYNLRTFVPTRPRYVPSITSSSPRTPLHRQSVPLSRYEPLGNLKMVGLHADMTTKKLESKQLNNKEQNAEKDSVVVEMHLNDGSGQEDTKKLEVTQRSEEEVRQKDKVMEKTKVNETKLAEKIDAINTTQDNKAKVEQVEVSTGKLVSADSTLSVTTPSNTLNAQKTKESIKTEVKNSSKTVEKVLQDKIKVEVEQIITSTLHKPTNLSHEEIKKEVVLTDKDLKEIQATKILNNGEARFMARNKNSGNEELHISVHQNTKTEDTTKNRAQKKYSTFPRPLRLIEQVPAGNYQLQTLAEPTSSTATIDNVNNMNNMNNMNNNDNNNYNYPTGNSNYYYDPVLALSQNDNYYGGHPAPVITAISGNSIGKPPSLYDGYPAENQQYAIGYEWIRMNPRMVNNNGESYIIMDPDYTNSKGLFVRPTQSLLQHLAQKNKYKPIHPIQEIRPSPIPTVQAVPSASIKDQVIVDQKNMAITSQMQQQEFSADNSPKHDQQIPTYYKKDSEKLMSAQANQSQKYVDSVQPTPFSYPMEVVKVPQSTINNNVKQVPVIQPATPIIPYVSAGPIAINPSLAFILIPLQIAQDPQMQTVVIN